MPSKKKPPELHLKPTLRPYQARPALALIRAVVQGDGGTYAVMMSRQAGKNELSAFVEATLLLAHRWQRRTGIKAAPTLKPQATISRDRLTHKLADAGYPLRHIDQYVYLARARWSFLSAGKEASVVGATADLLLECDEAQDVDPDKWNKDFMPMGATTDCPVVYYGTPWTDDDLLAQAIATAGPARTFTAKWDEVAESNAAYGRRAMRERDRLGANHPLFITQYELQTIPGAGRLLSASQLAAMRGSFPRQEAASRSYTYVAGIDVAGEDTAQPLRGRDSTIMTIGRVLFGDNPRNPPACQIVTAYEWTGTPHAQLFQQIVRIAQSWNCRLVAPDATTIGESLTFDLARALGEDKVIGVRFTERSKSDLGYGLQAAATTGRLQVWANDESREYRRMFAELTACRAEYKPNRSIGWSVPETAGHDDYVAAVALTAYAAEKVPRPRIARGTIRA